MVDDVRTHLEKNPEKSAINNSGIKQLSKMKLTSSIKTAAPFKSIFPINAKLLTTIIEDMKERGFDESQPLLLWKEEQVLIDGHTRLKAATEAGIQQVPIHEKSFKDETEVVEYVIHLQKDRRNLTDSELYQCILELDKRYKHGGDIRTEEIKSSRALLNTGEKPQGPQRSRDKTASVLGTSSTKVQKVRTIEDHGNEELKNDIAKGKVSINKAYKEIQQKRKQKSQSSEAVKPKTNVYWSDSNLIIKKSEESLVALELKLELNQKIKKQIKKALEAYSE